ncbi:MAG: Holliday junction branch migration protein RuvA [Gammaproteobacteria bacterium]
MIGRLRGRLAEKHPPRLLLDVNGVGYEVEAPMSTFYQLPELGAEVTLHTHLVVREDAQSLFGFYTERERLLFRNLIKVSGVGPRVAIAILSGISTDDFVVCVNHNDSAALTRIPGIGKKTAERLIVEMRDRLADWEQPAAAMVAPGGGGDRTGPASAVQDAVSALIALGYKAQEASKMVRSVAEEGLSSDEVIRRALQATVK